MFHSIVRPGARNWLFLPCVVLLSGCTPAAPPERVDIAKTVVVSSGPGEIELSDANVTLHDDNRVAFEVKYKFTKGKPDRYYMCEISFPGTKNLGAKPMLSWELKSEGVIKDALTLSMPPVQTYEIKVSEAVSPQDGYKLISNVISGKVK